MQESTFGLNILYPINTFINDISKQIIYSCLAEMLTVIVCLGFFVVACFGTTYT